MSAATLTLPTDTYDLSHGNYGSVQPIPQADFASNAEPRALVIGDLHGHLDRFEALLKQEGLLDYCPVCDGAGIVCDHCKEHHFECECPPNDGHNCSHCDGDGWARTDEDVEVILLGDIGHFGKGGSPTGDLLTWRAAVLWADVILWGNHDRAMVDEGHAFSGFQRHPHEVFHWIQQARWEGKLKLAHVSHGFLLTHAGLHLDFRNQDVDDSIKKDPREFAAWINSVEDPDSPFDDPHKMAVRDAISRKRGGGSPSGGILWRDIDEKLYDGFRQVFGHSADHKSHVVRFCTKNSFSRKLRNLPRFPSYCIDIGGKGDNPGDNCLAGIYLPDEKIVRVDL